MEQVCENPYNCQIEKIETESGKERMTVVCKENHWNETLNAGEGNTK